MAVMRATMPTISTNSPVPAHSRTHEPFLRKGALKPLQLMHCVLAGPEHVPQVEWHGEQTPVLFAYLPTGVQDARQVPLRVPT